MCGKKSNHGKVFTVGVSQFEIWVINLYLNDKNNVNYLSKQ